MSKKNDCFHEAGRAVILWLFGKSADIVKIDMSAKQGNRTCIRDCIYKTAHIISGTNLDDRLTEQYATVQAKIAVMYFLSRFAVQGRIDDVTDWLDCEMDNRDWENDRLHDMNHAVEIIKSLYGESRKAEQALTRWAHWCDEALVDSSVWDCIEALANYLNKAKASITGKQIGNILHNAWPAGSLPYRALGRKWRERFDV